MNAADREWHVSHLRTGARLRVLCILALMKERASVFDLMRASAYSQTTVRNALDHALRLDWVRAYTARPTRYEITPAGRQETQALAWAEADRVAAIDEPTADFGVNTADIDVNAAVIGADDQLSSPSMTTPVVDRRGRPAWCTPGHGVCRDCKPVETR